MEYKSYEILQKFADALIKKGFDDLPLQPKEEDLSGFKDLSNSWADRFSTALLNDLRKFFGEEVIFEIVKYGFEPLDINAQSTTYFNFKIKGKKKENTFYLRIKFLVFKKRIMVFLDYRTDINAIKDRELRKKLIKIRDAYKEGYEIPVELNNLT